MKMYNFPNIFDQLLNRSISEIVGTDFTISVPSANIVEHDNDYQIVLAVPGLDKSDFKIKVDKNVLHISADKENIALPEGVTIKRKEFNYSQFKRNFSLPENVNLSNIKAEYTDGILTVTLGKKENTTEESSFIKVE
jgi:HSP20 family protein